MSKGYFPAKVKPPSRRTTVLKGSKKMQMTVTANGHTVIRVSWGNYDRYQKTIDSYLALYGGKKTKWNNRFIYYEIYADCVNRK